MTRPSLRRAMNHRDLLSLFRSSHRSCSVEKYVLKNFPSFPGKQLYWSLFLIALQVGILSAKDCFYMFHLKILNKYQWRVWTRRDLDRVQSLFLKRKEAVARRFSVKNLFLEISQSLFFNKGAGLFNRVTPLVAASEHNNFIQSIAAKINISSFNISIKIPIKFCMLFKF